ncbi:MAG TPA: hypothetical protein VHY22_13430 [Chthoniobacteraceae bacterium]|nr:hypothetical protein [Chthoniobacteraceae bacterium]
MAFRVRSGQQEFERGVKRHRVSGLLARRQFGKTTIAARIALFKMMKTAGHTVVFGSIKLDLGREIVRKEADALQKAFRLMASNAQLQMVNGQTGKALPAALSADDFAELYEATRLEMRFYHSDSVYSRTKVVALTPDAVGETGDLILDEVGRVKNFRDVLEAVMPIIASNPEFRVIYTTTPPPDDTHVSFELLAPPIGAELPVNPCGNWYKSELGVWVLRITAEDAYADGVALYDDDTGAAITPAESRARAFDKDAWDRNYGCKFVMGGTSACGLMQLDTAQRRGIGECQFFSVGSDAEFDLAMTSIASKLGSGPVGGGWDLATTTKATSNPSSFSIVEGRGVEKIFRGIINWKTADPDVALERATKAVQMVAARKEGGPMRRLCIDATNERYFAKTAKKELSGLIQVDLVIASETIDLPGSEPMTMKQYLGGILVAELDDNHVLLPPDRYVREDWRMVRKEKGEFVCEPDASGRHGDTFDGAKLGVRALCGGGAAMPGGVEMNRGARESRQGIGRQLGGVL